MNIDCRWVRKLQLSQLGKDLPYPPPEKEASEWSSRRSRSRGTRYLISYRKVHLSRLMDWHSKGFQSECKEDHFWQLLKR